jgi:uncharacterized membrane protein
METVGIIIVIILIALLFWKHGVLRTIGRIILASIIGFVAWFALGGIWGYLAFIAFLVPTKFFDSYNKKDDEEEYEVEEEVSYSQPNVVIHNHYYSDNNKNETVVEADYYEITDINRKGGR